MPKVMRQGMDGCWKRKMQNEIKIAGKKAWWQDGRNGRASVSAGDVLAVVE